MRSVVGPDVVRPVAACRRATTSSVVRRRGGRASSPSSLRASRSAWFALERNAAISSALSFQRACCADGPRPRRPSSRRRSGRRRSAMCSRRSCRQLLSRGGAVERLDRVADVGSGSGAAAPTVACGVGGVGRQADDRESRPGPMCSSQRRRISSRRASCFAETMVDVVELIGELIWCVASPCAEASWPPETASATSAAEHCDQRRQRQGDRAVRVRLHVRSPLGRGLGVSPGRDRRTSWCGGEQADGLDGLRHEGEALERLGLGVEHRQAGGDRERVARESGRSARRPRWRERPCSAVAWSAPPRALRGAPPPRGSRALLPLPRKDGRASARRGSRR